MTNLQGWDHESALRMSASVNDGKMNWMRNTNIIKMQSRSAENLNAIIF